MSTSCSATDAIKMFVIYKIKGYEMASAKINILRPTGHLTVN